MSREGMVQGQEVQVQRMERLEFDVETNYRIFNNVLNLSCN